jgi:hypothetical protein
MTKLDPIVKKETGFIAWSSLCCTVVVQLIFLAFREWDLSVLLGGAVGWVVCVLNFFFMSLVVQQAVASGDESRAKLMIQSSYTWRTLAILGVIVVSLVTDFLHWVPVVASVFFPRIVISVRQGITKLCGKTQDEPAPTVPVQSYEEEEAEADGFERIVSHFGRKITPDYSEKQESDKTDSDTSSATKGDDTN